MFWATNTLTSTKNIFCHQFYQLPLQIPPSNSLKHHYMVLSINNKSMPLDYLCTYSTHCYHLPETPSLILFITKSTRNFLQLPHLPNSNQIWHLSTIILNYLFTTKLDPQLDLLLPLLSIYICFYNRFTIILISTTTTVCTCKSFCTARDVAKMNLLS